MKQTDWFKDAIIYQIYPRSFKDSNSDGLGDIKGIIEKIPYLTQLGINCIWLSPVYDSPQEDNGYDIADYYSIYPPFGTMDDLKELIAKLHENGIRLIMDLVVNHTSSESKWFKEAIEDPNSKYRDYYIIKEGRGKNHEIPPTNWSGFFGESTWSRIKDSNDYYLHLFAKGQPDLNWENPEVRQEVKNILKFYLDMGVDGFRCDVITLISKNQEFKDSKKKIALTGKENFVNGPRLHEYLHELNRDVLSNYDCMTVGETVMSSLSEAKDLVLPSREELSMVFNFDHTDCDNFMGVKYLKRKFKLVRFKKVFTKWQDGMYQKGWNSLFIENHDQRRSTGRFNTSLDQKYKDLSSKALATTYFLMQGTPFIYEGQEIGMTNGDFKSLDDLVDVEAHNIENTVKSIPFLKGIVRKNALSVTRDNARTPMQWDNSEFAGFSDTKPWLKVNCNKDSINVENAISNKDSLYYFYKDLIELRKKYPVIKDGKYEDLLPKDKNIFEYSRTSNNAQMIVVSNFSNKNLKLKSLDNYKDYLLLLSNYKDSSNKLRPYETRVYYKEK